MGLLFPMDALDSGNSGKIQGSIWSNAKVNH